MTGFRRIPETATVSGKLLLPFLAAADALQGGLDSRGALAALGLTPGMLQDPDTRLSHRAVEQLLRGAVEASGERDLGLLAAEHALPLHLDVLEYAARTRPTLGDAIASTIHYHAILHDGLESGLERSDTSAVWWVALRHGLTLPAAATEFALAMYVIAMRRITGMPDLQAMHVEFEHPKPPSIERHRRIFRCPLRFGAQRNALVIPPDMLDLSIASADPGLAALLDQQAARTLAQLERETATLANRVRSVLRNELANAQLSAEWVARRLGMSARTLHRKLQEERTSYREIIDELRRELALRYLENSELTVREVAYLLGFTTGPAFHRAFRRWTGTTAQAYRAGARRPAGER